MAKRNYYDILGVDENAKSDTIKKAYRKLAKENHPDTHPGDKQAEKKFKEISEAYSILSEPKKKQQYDQMRKYGFGGPGSGGGFSSHGVNFDLSDFFGGSQGPGQRRSHKQGSFKGDDFFSFGGLGDLFSQIFERDNGYGQQNYRVQRGKDVHVNLEIPFETAVLGGKANFSLEQEDVCSSCKGTGVKSAGKPSICTDCRGSGMVSRVQGAFAVNRPCPKCLGKGQLIQDPCLNCGGTGRVKAQKKYSLNISSGSESGNKLRLTGQGEPGGEGVPSGDLIITLRVGKHRFFWNKGNDIYCEVPIDKKRALKGTKARVKTIYDNTIELKIPANTKVDKTFRLKGMGVKNKQCSGDQYVNIKVT